MSTSQSDNHSLRGDGAFVWNIVFKDFFPAHDLTSLLKLKSFLMKRFLQTYENELQTSDTRSNSLLSIFSPERSFMNCSPATQSSNLMIEIDKVVCMDKGVYVCLYRYVLFGLVCTCSYLHIFTFVSGAKETYKT